MVVKRRTVYPESSAVRGSRSGSDKPIRKQPSHIRGTQPSDDGPTEDVVVQSFDKTTAKMLMARGVPYNDLPSGPKFSIREMLLKIEQLDEDGRQQKLISTGKQLRVLNSVLSNPLRGAYTLCISSRPSDARAKALAAMILHAALNTQKSKSHAKPLWHRVYGSFGDQLRDKGTTEPPSMLVIANLVEGSSAIKLEKVRDLLEKYSNIPRIIVYGGGCPLSLFTEKLHYRLTGAIYLGTHARKVQQI